ncbi:Glycosyltransferase involved in cell wall bisynthesis [Candidatus Methanophagaceae archaeon]|nr:Glycosyltransferase involved in cell wall bisynthesis [Methanophagales archaeon]
MALMNMKILIMDTIKPLDRDGSAIHRWELVNNLVKLGCEVYALSDIPINPEGVHIYPLPKRSKITYIIQLIKLVKRHHFDIIYTRNIIIGIIGLLIKKVCKLKLIREVNSISRDEWVLEEKQLTREWKRLRSIKLKFLGYLELFVIRKADAIIVVTQGIKSYLVKQGVNGNKIWVIENGANTELFKPIKNSNVLNDLKDRLHITDDERVVLFVGNLAPWQGVEYLLRAAPIIIEENPKTKILIVGDGVLKEQLELLSKELNIEHDLIFTGTVPYEKVPEYINISDVCAAPFIRARNKSMGLSPLKIYEYLACAKPVVASNIKGVGDLLEDSNSGVCVEPDNYNELATAIAKLLKDEVLRGQMGINGRKTVIEKYSWANTARKMKEVFENISEGSDGYH